MKVHTLLGGPKKLVARANQAFERHAAREQEFRERYKHIAQYSVRNDVPLAPMLLRVEVVNLCNADCVFCTYQFQTREIETMSFETFKLAVDQYAVLGGDFVSFTPLVGDALIDRGLEEKVAYAGSFPQFKRLEMWTNAILLTRKRFEALVEGGLTEFNISMSGFSADEYRDLYRNSNYAKVLHNLMEIAQSDALKKVRFVIWCRTGLAEPEKEPDYIKIAALNAFGIINQREMFSWHGQIKERDLPGKMFLRKQPREQRKACFQLWTGFTVMSNGDMTACGCTDIDGVGLPLGNIRDTPINAYLVDGRWEKMRDGFLAGDPPDFCKGCDMYWPVDMRDPEDAVLTKGADALALQAEES